MCGGGRGCGQSHHRVFGARGQLGMLSSLGISSPCCWSVFCTWLYHWSRSLPAFPALRITWSEGWKGGECSFILCGVMGEEETIFPSHVSSPQWSAHLAGVGGAQEINVWQLEGDGGRSTMCTQLMYHEKLNYLFCSPLPQPLKLYTDRKNVSKNHRPWSLVTLMGHRLPQETRAWKCFRCCYSRWQNTAGQQELDIATDITMTSEIFQTFLCMMCDHIWKSVPSIYFPSLWYSEE